MEQLVPIRLFPGSVMLLSLAAWLARKLEIVPPPHPHTHNQRYCEWVLNVLGYWGARYGEEVMEVLPCPKQCLLVRTRLVWGSLRLGFKQTANPMDDMI